MDTTTKAPEKVPFTDSELALGDALGKDRGMLELTHRCPECEALILVCDNAIWLDAQPTTDDGPLAMGVMRLGGLSMAAGGNIDGGSHHLMHEHQPPESS